MYKCLRVSNTIPYIIACTYTYVHSEVLFRCVGENHSELTIMALSPQPLMPFIYDNLDQFTQSLLAFCTYVCNVQHLLSQSVNCPAAPHVYMLAMYLIFMFPFSVYPRYLSKETDVSVPSMIVLLCMYVRTSTHVDASQSCICASTCRICNSTG